MNYNNVIYKDKDKPNSYDYLLVDYLINRYGINKNSKILDVGCGKGFFSKVFTNEGMCVYKVDKEKITKDIEECDLDKEELPYIDNVFDVVFSKSNIEHINNTDNYMSEIYRVLKPGGRVIILTPDWQSQMNIFYNDYSHVKSFTIESLKDLLKIYNFSDVESEEFIQLPATWDNRLFRALSKLTCMLLPKPKSARKNKWIRFSCEKMILASGIKQ